MDTGLLNKVIRLIKTYPLDKNYVRKEFDKLLTTQNLKIVDQWFDEKKYLHNWVKTRIKREIRENRQIEIATKDGNFYNKLMFFYTNRDGKRFVYNIMFNDPQKLKVGEAGNFVEITGRSLTNDNYMSYVRSMNKKNGKKNIGDSIEEILGTIGNFVMNKKKEI